MKKFSDYLRIQEAAQLLGVAGNTIRAWDKTGKLKAIRDPMSNHRLYKKEDLLNLLRELEAKNHG